MRKSLRRTLGFTLVELIVVILLLGILSAYAASRYSGTSSVAALTTQQEILASLRLTQNRAMQRTGYCNRWLVTANQAGQISPQAVAGSCSSIFAAVDNDISRVEAPSGVTLSLSTPNGYLDFDSLGRAAQCTASPCTVTISSTHDQRQVCINTEGYIYAC
ncbi:prepilin-type N-terminal cleavage/methylation domain-containing protein [Vibrio sp. V31_P5A7T61]|uniref:pilus assembly FimT family protein n=1 Tax=unclassified Vibrio TaxID=2614977 RepID=UPI001372AB5B|nr:MULTISPECIES: type II secretion system protein [unclassified Vibrio]NAW63532.1 prepilin-type N-terminal cleavage/methylation domain-containing protein [Vibrio sp. V31_P5A7T61]NAX02184.1 prepilin-type N-terminal cleavage/methylation domain-containing protein [Vibrio sp. V34_P3A8T189]NAX06666.1 prepilin-type N-terminal cleavage/methylation domain-containing protein [Vibrio sp. V40_P2S30T141]NAX64707.1 prepilin-type N-terminal cleavage/methylation domain-containing protein [Vibrio sp. V32_P6A28